MGRMLPRILETFLQTLIEIQEPVDFDVRVTLLHEPSFCPTYEGMFPKFYRINVQCSSDPLAKLTAGWVDDGSLKTI